MADLDYLEKAIGEAPTPDLLNEHHETQLLLNDIYLAWAKGHFIRSRVQYIEENEKCLEYFLAIEKRSYKTKCVKCLETPNGGITRETDILDEEKSVYQNMYSTNREPSDNLVDTVICKYT